MEDTEQLYVLDEVVEWVCRIGIPEFDSRMLQLYGVSLSGFLIENGIEVPTNNENKDAEQNNNSSDSIRDNALCLSPSIRSNYSTESGRFYGTNSFHEIEPLTDSDVNFEQTVENNFKRKQPSKKKEFFDHSYVLMKESEISNKAESGVLCSQAEPPPVPPMIRKPMAVPPPRSAASATAPITSKNQPRDLRAFTPKPPQEAKPMPKPSKNTNSKRAYAPGSPLHDQIAKRAMEWKSRRQGNYEPVPPSRSAASATAPITSGKPRDLQAFHPNPPQPTRSMPQPSKTPNSRRAYAPGSPLHDQIARRAMEWKSLRKGSYDDLVEDKTRQWKSNSGMKMEAKQTSKLHMFYRDNPECIQI